MLQILHIFRKDGRRHWPEILASLALLGAYARNALHPWSHSPAALYARRFLWMNELIAPSLVLLWIFLVIRIVHGETLVGDRQWWVTKPYVWWKLLLAKCLFVFTVVSVPLFFIQLYLLAVNDFPIFRNLSGVLRLQLGLAASLFLFAFLLGSLTRNLAQAVLTIVCLFVAIFAIVRLADNYSSSAMSVPGMVPDSIQGPFWLLCAVGLVLWQFAFRKTWQSRGLLCVGVALAALVANVSRGGNYIENTYPLVKDEQAPARFAMNLHSPGQEKVNENDWSEFLPEIPLRIPLKISGVAPRSMIISNGIKLTLTAPDGAVWTKGWKPAFAQVWPEDEVVDFTYGMNRKDFEKWKNTTAQVHLELAISLYVEDRPRELVLRSGIFSDQQLGTCRINPDNVSYLDCLRPFHAPAYMATFDGRESPCVLEKDRASQAAVWHSWSSLYEPDLIEPGLSPMTDHTIYFQEPKKNDPRREFNGLRLCEGAKIRFAYPKFSEGFRIKLDISAISVAALSRGRTSLD